MTQYLVLIALLTILNVHYTQANDDINFNHFQSSEEVENVRLSRSRRDDDYSDEGGFMSAAGHAGDDDFIANIRDCANGSTRAPWGKCISCKDYQRKFKKIGMGC